MATAVENNRPLMAEHLLKTYKSDLQGTDCHFTAFGALEGSDRSQMISMMLEHADLIDFGMEKDQKMCHESTKHLDEASIKVESWVRTAGAKSHQKIGQLQVPAAGDKQAAQIYEQVRQAGLELDPVQELQVQLGEAYKLQNRLRKLENFEFYCPFSHSNLQLTQQGIAALLR